MSPDHPQSHPDSEPNTLPAPESEASSVRLDATGDAKQKAFLSTVSAEINELPPLDPTAEAPFVPGHTVERPLGSGTYGHVWLYRENHSRRRVAIKFLKRKSTQQWQVLQAEVRQLAMLDGDPGIVQLRQVEPENDPPYYVMTYAEGGSLVDRLAKGALAVDEAIRIFERVTQSLAYVHVKGVRHCDLKPGNVLLDALGRPLIADFGQAHIEGNEVSTLGTFFYMAPEQADLAEAAPDARWDVYSLGAIFYAMLMGRAPRWCSDLRSRLKESSDLNERLRLYRDGVGQLPRVEDHRRLKGLDRRLVEVIDRCLEIDPDRRFRDAGDVLRALERRNERRQRSLLSLLMLLPTSLLLMLVLFARWLVRGSVDAVERAGNSVAADLAILRARLFWMNVCTLIALSVTLLALCLWVAARRGSSYNREN